MGRVGQSQHSHYGSEDLRDRRSPGPVVLPIFGSNFEGHGVQYPIKEERRWEGVSAEGWGTHPNGRVDCLNTQVTLNWRLGVDADYWQNLYNLEATTAELNMPALDAARSIISRLVISVHILYGAVIYIPDPQEWAVYIPHGGVVSSGTRGFLVPRPDTDIGGSAARASMARRRPFTLKNCID